MNNDIRWNLDNKNCGCADIDGFHIELPSSGYTADCEYYIDVIINKSFTTSLLLKMENYDIEPWNMEHEAFKKFMINRLRNVITTYKEYRNGVI